MKKPTDTKNKVYRIRTLEDILKCVEKTNVDGFLKDFEGWLRTTLEVKEEAKRIPQIKFNMLQTAFIWHDDGDYGTLKQMTVTFTDKTKNKENTVY